ncbi:MAG: hypothetical protein M9887_09620 [Chitinophagales bacterium]|nr:hypothetical protein [Chitinophagales bacterium]
MKKLLIHVGVPKTATTTLQESIFYPLGQSGIINYFGRVQFEKDPIYIEKFVKMYRFISGSMFYKGDLIFNIPLNEKLRNESLNREREYTKHLNYNIFRSVLEEGICNVYSDENIVAPYDFIFRLSEIPDRIGDIFVDGDTNCKILITIRKQTETIPSVFAEKFHEYIKFEKYSTPQKLFFGSDNKLIKDERFLGHDYSYLIDTYQRVFGKENVKVAMFEELRENKFYYHELVADLLGIDLEVVKEVSTEKRYRDKIKAKSGEYITNIPIPGLRQRIMKAIINSKYSHGVKVLLNKFPNISYRLKQLTKPNKSFQQIVPSFTQAQLDTIYNEYLESNNKLHEVHGLDKEKLQKYGYI